MQLEGVQNSILVTEDKNINDVFLYFNRYTIYDYIGGLPYTAINFGEMHEYPEYVKDSIKRNMEDGKSASRINRVTKKGKEEHLYEVLRKIEDKF